MAKQTTTTAPEKELQEQIAELRADIKNITSKVGAIGSEHFSKAKDKAESYYESAKSQGEDVLKDVKDKIHGAERNLVNCVREKPVESIAVAALAGVVLALILRR